MQYELAKKLKDAGFPQKGSSHEWYSPEGELFINPVVVVVNDWIATPTLSELIEACGVIFCALIRQIDIYERLGQRWLATSIFYTVQSQARGVGNTPEEAVANLWLAMNN